MLTNRQAKAHKAEQKSNPLDMAIAGRDGDTLTMVRDAIRHKQIVLSFQPVIAAQAPAQTAFYEGFVRVLDATGRIIPAGDFMPAIENTELGREIDCIALEVGLRELARWPGIRLSINMSARSIGYRRWSKVLERGLKKDPTLGERLILEITERSAMMVPEIVIDFMDSLQPRGITFALDDFGAGEIAFRHFREFFFDLVKIDSQFVRNIHTSRDNQALTAALISVAQKFDMFTVAEGVETPEEANVLIQMGADCLQGYLFGAPSIRPPWIEMPADQQSA